MRPEMIALHRQSYRPSDVIADEDIHLTKLSLKAKIA
jgi:hypothetical protein